MDVRRASACRLLAAMAIVLASWNCGGSPGRPGEPPPSLIPGATPVYGTERLAWGQEGYPPLLRFVAYVNDSPVPLGEAQCTDGIPEASCSSPLPPLSDGVHTIRIAAVSLVSGTEGDRSDAITVQKLTRRSTASASTWSVPDIALPVWGVEVVANDLPGAVQMAPAPDGRVFVSERGGRVRVLHTAGHNAGAAPAAIAYGADVSPSPLAAGPPGITLHPDFATNHLVYLAYLEGDDEQRSRVRIVRLREVAGTLGEAATLMDVPVVVDRTAQTAAGQASSPDGSLTDAARTTAGPRLAFGPDRRMLVLLPSGLQFDDPSLASRLHASVMRLDDEGRVPAEGVLRDIESQPLGLTWRPGTETLWGLFAPTTSSMSVRPMDNAASPTPSLMNVMLNGLDIPVAGGLSLQGTTPATIAWATVFMAGFNADWQFPVRLVTPVEADPFQLGSPGHITDIVPAGDGTLLVSFTHAGDAQGYVLRVTPPLKQLQH